jgi:hypothetical protein
MTATVMGFSFAWCMIQVAYNDFTYEVLRDDYYGAIYFQLKARNVGAIGSSSFGW